jgi:hypothetical protein
MKISAKMSVYLVALLLLVSIGGFFQLGSGLSAAPQGTSYSLGPFEAIGISTNQFTARIKAMGEVFDQVYGPGGVASQLPDDEAVVAIHIIDEEFFSPEYVITYTVTVDQISSTPKVPSSPLGGGLEQ